MLLRNNGRKMGLKFNERRLRKPTIIKQHLAFPDHIFTKDAHITFMTRHFHEWDAQGMRHIRENERQIHAPRKREIRGVVPGGNGWTRHFFTRHKEAAIDNIVLPRHLRPLVDVPRRSADSLGILMKIGVRVVTRQGIENKITPQALVAFRHPRQLLSQKENHPTLVASDGLCALTLGVCWSKDNMSRRREAMVDSR
jgi:hypothetical protein